MKIITATILFILITTLSCQTPPVIQRLSYTKLCSQVPYRSIEDPYYKALPGRVICIESYKQYNNKLLIMDKVGVDPKGNAIYIDKFNYKIIIGKGKLFIAHNQNGIFTFLGLCGDYGFS